MAQKMLLISLLLGLSAQQISAVQEGVQNAANPIRKVVTMLQKMQAEVTTEGKKEAELYKKFMCYCKTSGNALSTNIADGKAKIESLETQLKETGENLVQTKANLVAHTASRNDAKKAIDDATALREKEAAAYAKESSDLTINIAALTKAIAALEKGVAGAFLQTNDANILRKFTMEKADLPDAARDEVLAFLSGNQGQGYVPQSGEIIGILKQIKDEMMASLKDATATENEAIANYEALMAAKNKEIEMLTAQIEDEQMRIGSQSVNAATMENDLEDTKEALAADEKFLEELKQGCGTKTAEWEEIKKTRAEEMLALAETIKVLNDDDALELFKKTLPSAGSSFIQVQVGIADLKARALAAVRSAIKKNRQGPLPGHHELDLIALALNGKQMGFEKVISMIDTMVANLKQEQVDDDSKKDYCNSEFDKSDDTKKVLEQSISDSETAIADTEGVLATLKEEIAALEAGIKALDKSVAEATDLRKAENAAYKQLMSDDSTAKEVLLWAKNRLNKFYNPKLYKAAPERELSAGEDIAVRMGGTASPTPAPGGVAGTGIGAAFVQIAEQTDDSVAPPPPPETFGAYQAKGAQGTGVIAMIDLLVKDLNKEMAEAEVMEKDGQKEYEEMTADAAAKRAQDSKSLTEKNSAKAAEEEALMAEKEKKSDTSKELVASLEYISSLHGECDWLMKYYEVRKEARTTEIEALGNAKAVLSGADYSLVQSMRTVSPHVGFLAMHK